MKKATNADIELVINTFIKNNIMFTHYDITKTIRSSNMMVMHSDVKAFTQNVSWPYFYIKKIIKVAGQDSILYYPDHMDANTYNASAISEPTTPVMVNRISVDSQGNVVKSFVQKFATPAPVNGGMQFTTNPNTSNVTSTVAPTSTLSKSCFDKRGRLHIAKKDVSSAGFSKNQLVYVSVKNGCILITDISNTGVAYTVDSHGAIRLSNAIVRQSNLSNPKVSISLKSITIN